ncbi:MAG: ASKHA domain-containing protein [Bacillota bacterium]|nr:ASKHA domain-containing protein [Bacillota bacterium]
MRVRFLPDDVSVEDVVGEKLVTLAATAGIVLRGACGGAGTCGRCRVTVREGRVALGTDGDTVLDGPADVPACRCRPLSDLVVEIPETARLREHRVLIEAAGDERLLPELRDAVPGTLSALYRTVNVALDPPTANDNRDDLTRLLSGLGAVVPGVVPRVGLDVLRDLPGVLREGRWRVTVGLAESADGIEVSALMPGYATDGVLGLALDLGTTTVAGQLVDLATGRVVAEAGAYNRQAAFGDDVISRIVYAVEEKDGLAHLQREAAASINSVLQAMLAGLGRSGLDVRSAVCAGNPTMIHLLFGVDPGYLRLEPYVPAADEWPAVRAAELGLALHPRALVHTLPGVASYLGGDITGGLVAAGVDVSDELTLFLDVGTNGEMVLGNREWLVGCACSAGPAFEGGGIACGMRAETGAIERVGITAGGYEVVRRTVGDAPPAGLCGSGLIGTVAALRRAGVIDRAGRFVNGVDTPRLRPGPDGPEFVIAWPAETAGGRAITLGEAEIANILRAKAAVFAGIRSMLNAVGIGLNEIERVVIAGGFGRYLHLADAVAIGLLPDLPPERYSYLGNTALKGARAALLAAEVRTRVAAAAERMTYLDLSMETGFMDEFMRALFLPHTDESLFPTVAGHGLADP